MGQNGSAEKPPERVVEFIRRCAASDEYAAYCRNLLADLLEIDTAIGSDIGRLAANEARVFDLLESELRAMLGAGGRIERRPIQTTIAEDPFYSQPYYAADDSGRIPPVDVVYGRRRNLMVSVDAGAAGRGCIYNTHVDTVAPHFAAKVEGQRVTGRGACDAKGQVALLVGQVKLLEQMRQELGVAPAGPRIYQFVIDEEMGGNGSLSLAREGRWRGYEVIVHEPTSNIPHPANRGAVWYRCQLSAAGQEAARPLEMMPFVVTNLESAGRQIREESTHPLFGPQHVQTNHGILGCYGSHPSAVNDHVAVILTIQATANPERIQMRLVEIMDAVLADYCRHYGDKTRQIDPSTGQPALSRHYELRFLPGREGLRYRLDFFGKAGHMAAVQDCDGAITKAAYVLRALLKMAQNYPMVQAWGELADQPGVAELLILEGGQGFVPTHSLEQVKARVAEAARAGAKEYCELKQVPFRPGMAQVSFQKLHNEAYASPLDCPAFQAFADAFRALGLTWPKPSGCGVSCDARIYAHHGHNVVTFGPGGLDRAHSATESIETHQIQQALAISALAAVGLAGLRGPETI
jgi:acetylornithine deacetylase/succinyl-diaminopimelate desuccinylase-like protein